MGVVERKRRGRAEREERITAAARRIAAEEGWPAVTVRRLADAIEYSQPVLYSHFENRDAVVAAVAIEGFRELAALLGKAGEENVADPAVAASAVAATYLAFAADQPALYAAMFTMPTSLRFAVANTPPEARAAFAALAAVVPQPDRDTATELFWATLHGLAELDRSGRIRPDAREERLRLAARNLGWPSATNS